MMQPQIRDSQKRQIIPKIIKDFGDFKGVSKKLKPKTKSKRKWDNVLKNRSRSVLKDIQNDDEIENLFIDEDSNESTATNISSQVIEENQKLKAALKEKENSLNAVTEQLKIMKEHTDRDRGESDVEMENEPGTSNSAEHTDRDRGDGDVQIENEPGTTNPAGQNINNRQNQLQLTSSSPRQSSTPPLQNDTNNDNQNEGSAHALRQSNNHFNRVEDQNRDQTSAERQIENRAGNLSQNDGRRQLQFSPSPRRRSPTPPLDIDGNYNEGEHNQLNDASEDEEPDPRYADFKPKSHWVHHLIKKVEKYYGSNGPGHADRQRRYEMSNDKIYLGAGKYVSQSIWILIQKQKPSIFYRDLLTMIWTPRDLANRALDVTKVQSLIPNRSPVKVVERNLLLLSISIYSDFLMKKKNLTMEDRSFYLSQCTAIFSKKVRDLRSQFLKKEIARQNRERQ